MINSLKFHFKILFKGTGYFYVCIFMIVLGLLATILSIDNTDDIRLISQNPDIYNTFWMIPLMGTFRSLFMLLLPIIVSIPCVQFLIGENKTYQFLITRSSRKTYLRSKFIVFFFSGFSLVLIMMIFHRLFIYIVYNSSQDIYNVFFPINNEKVMYTFFLDPDKGFSNPAMMSLRIVLSTSIWGGVLSVLVLAINAFIHRAIISMIITFTMVFFESYVVTSFEYVIKELFKLSNNFTLMPHINNYMTFSDVGRSFPSIFVLGAWIALFIVFLCCSYFHETGREV